MYIKKKTIHLILKIIFSLIHLIIVSNIFINKLDDKVILNREIKSIEEYFKFCNEGKLFNKRRFLKSYKPKVSIIISMYNKEQYLLRLLRSIQNQLFKDLEIIFVDDSSTDNSVKLVKSFQNEDKRIILIKNKKNKGTLISRIIGILKSMGKYIMVPDADDIFSKDIIKTCYNLATKNNYEMIRYNVFTNGSNVGLTDIVLKLNNKPIFQPELSNYLFYGFGHLGLHDFTLWNKFIKEDAFKKSINNIDPFYLNQYMIIFEDGLINFSLYKTINSYFLLKKVGYYYIFNRENSVQHKKDITKELAKYVYLYIKFILDNSKNNKHEKDMALHVFHLYKWHAGLINLINKDFQLYREVINFFINYEFIEKNDKNEFQKLKDILDKREKLKKYS